MADDYISLAYAKSVLKLTHGDDDAFLNDCISAASRQIDEHCGRRFWLDATPVARIINPRQKVIADPDGDRLLVDDIGSATITVEVGRASSWTDISSSIEAEPTDAADRDPAEPYTSLMYYGGVFPRDGSRVRITTRWGWPELPKVVSRATMIQTNRLYKRRESPEGVFGSAEWNGVVRMSRIDPDVAALLTHLVLPGFA